MTSARLARRAKRALDIFIAALALIAAAPVIILVALVVRLAMGSPVLFRSERAGLHGRPFVLLKFRTMVEAGDGVPDTARLTRTGRWLRRLSIDELPQFWNVLAGEMSIVGPRPLLSRYLPRYSSDQRRRHEVPPGITGWAQVNGRNTLSWSEKFTLDVWYVDHWSLGLDLRILWRTMSRVLGARETTPRQSEIMDEFLG